MNITEIIQQNVASWWMDPDEINSRRCEDFDPHRNDLELISGTFL